MSKRRRLWFLVLAFVPALAYAGADEWNYESMFRSGEVGKEWSRADIGTTPLGGRKFLGPFAGHEPVRLDLGEIDAGGDAGERVLRIRFTLFVIHGADGNYVYYGPDPWVLRVVDGPELWRTTFSNCGFIAVNNDQGYPDPFPGTHHPAWTGAAEKGSLGYIKTWGGKPNGVDSVYDMEAYLPHRKGEVALEFLSESEETISGEAWGLEKVRMDLVPVQNIDPAEFKTLWEDLAGDDSGKATQALWRLVSAGKKAREFLKERLDLRPIPGGRVSELLVKLDSGDFRSRELASRELMKLGAQVRGILQKELAKEGLTPEKRARLAGLLERIQKVEDVPLKGERLRKMRAQWALKILEG